MTRPTQKPNGVQADICNKRLETDIEFRKRLREEHGLSVSTLATPEEIDDLAWDQRKVQRRIVEDFT